MTLICTVVSVFGILQLSDSLTTRLDGSHGSAPKLFELKVLNGVASIAGAYAFQGQDPGTWLAEMEALYVESGPRPTLGGFAHFAGRFLTINVTDFERHEGHLVHLAGYERTADAVRPNMWFIRSWAAMDSAGDYADRANPFLVTEDFWNRYEDTGTNYRQAIERGGWVYFVNGATEGRVAFNTVRAASPAERNRAGGSSLQALSALMKEDMEEACANAGPDVGGEIRISVLEPPETVDWSFIASPAD
jgi:hypothetical protein